MPKPISFGEIDTRLVSTMEETKGVAESETSRKVIILGDFSCRTNRGILETGSTLDSRRIIPADRDNIDEALRKLSLRINLPILGKNSEPVSIRFSEMDDFHPDRLFETLDVFQALKEIRQGLKDPSTFAILAKESPILPSPLAGEGKGEGDFLDQVIEKTEGKEPYTKSTHRMTEWDSFLQEIVRPHIVPDIEKKLAEMIASVDATIGELMRMILHHHDFQAIEATWRAVNFLVSRMDTDGQIKRYAPPCLQGTG